MENNNKIHENIDNKINNGKLENPKFDEQSYEVNISNTENEIAEEKKANNAKIEELKRELTSEGNLIPINDFIINEKER
jgi:hypothetical protein